MKAFRVTALILILVGLTLAASAWAQQQDRRAQEPAMELPPELADFKLSPTEELLLRKLDLSQDVLEAIVVQDPESLRDYAEEFIGLIESEDWTVLGGSDPAYAEMTNDFRKSVRALHVMSKDKNPNNMTKGYFNMVDRCVACHTSATSKQAE